MWLAALFALEAAGTLDVSDTARIYAREAALLDEADEPDEAALDIENTPRLAATLDWPTTSLGFEYAPRLFWSDVAGPEASPTLLLHNAGLWLSAREERLTVSLAQTFAIGDQSFARLSAERGPLQPEPAATGGLMASPELELVPGPTVVRVIAVESSASLRYDLSRRVSMELRPSFGISGGADAAAQQAMPRQRTARFEASIDVRASRRDTLGTKLGLAQISTSNAYDHRIVSLMEIWSRTFAPESGSALGAGVALQETTRSADSNGAQWQPIGVASVWHMLRAHAPQVRVRGDLGYQPHLNVLSGALQHQLFATAGATMLAGDASVAFTLGAAQTLPRDEPDAAQSLTADLVLEQALLDWLSAELGGQLAWQSLGSDVVLGSSDARWLLFAGARGELPSVRF